LHFGLFRTPRVIDTRSMTAGVLFSRTSPQRNAATRGSENAVSKISEKETA